MNRTIEISEATFARLQKYATPLVDSPDTAIGKLIGLVEGAPAGTGTAVAPTKLDPYSPPDLTHTKVTGAKVNGRSLLPAQCYWNAVMLAAVHQAATQLLPKQSSPTWSS